MRRLALLLTVFAVTATVSVAAVVFIDLAWNHRAANTCNEEAEKPRGAARASGYSIRWEWTEFAHVCSYDAPGDPRKRVGFTDAFP
jgi:hypothetical protein